MKDFRSRILRKTAPLAAVLGLLVCAAAAQTLPLPSGPPIANEVRFAALGDSGNGNDGQLAVARQMFAVQQNTKFDLIVFLGDNIYNSGSPGDFGRKFTLPYRQFIENGTEMRGVVGNHDVRGEADGGVLLQQMMFQMGTRPYFAFARGGGQVEFFGIDSNAFITPNLSQNARDQLQWLDRELGGSRAKWKILLLHHPLYSSAKKHGWTSRDQGEMESVRNAIEPLLERHGVKIVLAGHDHVYERVKPQKGIFHFVSGTGSETRVGDIQSNSPFYGFGSDRELGFMLFSAANDRVNFWAINAQGGVVDSGTLR